jgi:hypothetical protein
MYLFRASLRARPPTTPQRGTHPRENSDGRTSRKTIAGNPAARIGGCGRVIPAVSAFCFRALRCPISRRKGNAPKSRANLHKIDTYLPLLSLMRAEIDHSTEDLLAGFRVAKREQLPDRDLWTQQDHCTMRIYGDGVRFFRGRLVVDSLRQRHHRNFYHDPLTAALGVPITTV